MLSSLVTEADYKGRSTTNESITSGLADVPKVEDIERILDLKRTKNIFILAHNFQSPEVQFIADFVGDALALSMEAARVEQPSVVVCGPDFMVETTKLLAPEKKVLYANRSARCPMAAMVTPDDIKDLKEQYPESAVVGYLNTSAETKCELDICCTAANAAGIVASLEDRRVIFVPDRNLGAFVRTIVPEKELVLWPGFCSVHEVIRQEDIEALLAAHPGAKVLAHPECRPEVLSMADAVLSTDGIKKYGSDPGVTEFIVATELEVAGFLSEQYPDKQFYGIEKAWCRTQKKVRLSNVLSALENLEPEVDLPARTLERARLPVDRMLAFTQVDS